MVFRKKFFKQITFLTLLFRNMEFDHRFNHELSALPAMGIYYLLPIITLRYIFAIYNYLRIFNFLFYFTS